MKKALITGANGQDGFYLKALLEQNAVKVTGVSRQGSFLKTNVANFSDISSLIKKEQPDFIFHLAANSTTNHGSLLENFDTISKGTLNILESVKEFSPGSAVFISGSGLQFLNVGEPIRESDAFAANDAYAMSRIQSVYAARYFRSLGIKVYVGYFFNHDSSLRTERHISKKITAAVQRIANGSKERLEIGDMSVVKEWSYAGDIVKGIKRLVEQDSVFEANISSGEGHSIKDWVDACFRIAGLVADDHIVASKNFSAAYPVLVSDNSIITSLGYRPTVSFEDLAKKMMADEI